MPRILPWNRIKLTEPEPELSAPVRTPSRPHSVAPNPSPRHSASSKRSPSAPRKVKTEIKTERAIRSLKSPSTSPPPEPLSEAFMIEGLEDDDRFRMVEDELFSVANRFTAHLHAAEYQRQKREAKTRNAGTIDSISRPVVGRMTPSVRSKQERAAKTRVRRDGVRKAIANARDGGLDADSEDEEESPWMGTSLQGLMETDVHQGPSTRLSRITSLGPSTKVSARSTQAGGQALTSRPPAARATGEGQNAETTADEDEETDDGDDLEAPPKRPALPVLPSSRSAARSVTTLDSGSRASTTAHPPPRQATRPLEHGEPSRNAKAPSSMSHRSEVAIVPVFSDDEEDLFTSRKRRRQEKESRTARGASRR